VAIPEVTTHLKISISLFSQLVRVFAIMITLPELQVLALVVRATCGCAGVGVGVSVCVDAVLSSTQPVLYLFKFRNRHFE
jgi:hypothetical protein